jgi:TPR repeat protein
MKRAGMKRAGVERADMERAMGRTTAPKFLACLCANLAFLIAAGGPASAEPPNGSAPIQLVRDDYDPAAKAIFNQASRGNARAQTQLGVMYEYGRGVPQNYLAAVHWYQCAAEQGDANGQYLLGLMYEKGHGVPQSDTLAYMWLNLATGHAAPRVRDYFAHVRDAVANKLTPAQMGDAQWLALNFIPKASP